MAATITQTSKPLHPRVLDTSGNGNHGTAYTGQALEFDGISDGLNYTGLIARGVSMLTTSGALSSQDSRTFAFWHKSNGSISSTQQVFSAAGGGGGTGLGIGIATDGDIVLEVKAGGVRHTAYFTAGMGDSTWKRYVVVFDAVNKSLLAYVNGVSLTANFSQNVGGWSGNSTSSNGYLGTLNGTTWPLDGWLSDFQCWNVAWTASDALYDYNNPEILATSGGGTSLAYENLKLWHPMNDSARGQQINLLDGANTGKHTFATLASASASSLSNYIYALDGNGNNVPKVSGQAYKYTWTIDSHTSGGGVKVHPETTDIGYVTSVETHTTTFVATGTTDHRLYANAWTGTISNFTVEAVNLKSHGTSVFYGDEILSNTGFETLKGGESGNTAGTVTDLFDNWTVALGGSSTVEADTDVSPQAGTYACKMTYNGGQSYIYQDATVVSGRNYTLTFYVRGDGSNSGHIRVHKTTGGDYIAEADIGQTAASWSQKTYTFTADANGDVRIRLLTDTATSSVWFDEVSFKETGFATGWTDADAQPTIPQLGFQSYNQLGMFNGVDTSVTLGSDVTLAHDGMTFSCWLYRNEVDAHHSIFGNATNNAQGLYVSSSDNCLRLKEDGSSLMTSTQALSAGEWHHIVVTHAADNDGKFYINGVKEDPSTDAIDADIILREFGTRGDNDLYLNGSLTECSAWNVSMTDAQAQELYNDGEALDATLHSSAANLVGYWRNRGTGTWTDLSTNSNNGTPANVSEYLILPEGNNGRDTQGFLMNRTSTSGIQHTGAIAGSYSRFGHGTKLLSTPVSNASVECWFRSFGGTGASEGYAAFFGSRASNNILLCRNSTAGTVSGLYYLTSGGNQNNLDSTTNCFDDEWHHIAFTFDSGVGKLYIDGSLEDTQDDTGDTIRMGSNTYYMETGADSGQGSRSFSGDVDDIGVYSTTLTANQVARNYKAGKARHRD